MKLYTKTHHSTVKQVIQRGDGQLQLRTRGLTHKIMIVSQEIEYNEDIIKEPEYEINTLRIQQTIIDGFATKDNAIKEIKRQDISNQKKER